VVTQTTKPERTASSSSTGGPSVCGSTAAVRSLPGHLPLEHPSRGAAQSRYALNSSAVPSDDSAPSNASSFGESQCEGSQSTEGTSSLGAVHWLGPLEASELDPKEIELHECIGSSSNGSVYRGMWMGVGVAVKYFQPPKAVPPRNADPACTTDPKSALHPVDSCERDFLHEAQLLHELRHPVRHRGCLQEQSRGCSILTIGCNVAACFRVHPRDLEALDIEYRGCMYWLRRTCCCSSAC
jgi:hypothetical protein